MVYGILADTVLLIHTAWILFVCFGLVLAVIRPVVGWIHGGALVFTLLLNVMGWYCPLTVLENHILSVLNDTGKAYQGNFLAHYLVPLVYPDLPEKAIRIGVSLFVGANLAGYGILLRRRRHREGPGKGGPHQEGRG